MKWIEMKIKENTTKTTLIASSSGEYFFMMNFISFA